MAFLTDFFDRLTNAADSVLSIVGAVLLITAMVLLAVALRRAWKQSRLTEVVIETLGDATGDATAGAVALGLTYRLREEVVATLPVLADHARRAVQRAESDSTSPLRALMLEDIDRREALLGDITSSQNDLMQSMESMVPQAARGAFRVVTNSFLRPKEVRIMGVLQRLNDDGGGVGLSFNVNHVGAEEAASRITLWEDGDSDVDEKTVVQRFHALIPPAARALACELLRQRLKLTMSKRNRRHSIAARSGGPQVDREAVVELLVGGSYQNAAHLSAPATKSFYELAAQALKKSAGRLQHYKLSYQLANTVAELGRRQGADQGRTIELLSESTKLLGEATRQLPGAKLQPAHHQAEELRIKAALTVNACLVAELLSDDEAKSEHAAGCVAELISVDPVAYDSEGVLYNVACALAVAARVEALARHGADKETCLDRSKLWLLHACARNERWWTHGTADRDLCLLREWIPEARRRWWEASQEGPPDAEAIRARVEAVVEALRPKVPPSSPAPWRGDALKAIVGAVVKGS